MLAPNSRIRKLPGFAAARRIWREARRLARHANFVRARRQLRNDVESVRKSGLFDAAYYLTTYPDVAHSGGDPLLHYLQFGWLEGRVPSRKFDPSDYLARHKDVAQAGLNPLLHFVNTGRDEGRTASACRTLESKVSKANYAELAQLQMSLFLLTGQRLRIPPCPRPKVSILMVLYNRCELTYLALQSIVATCQMPYEIVIVDNASTDQTDELLARLDNVRIVRNPDNAGFVRAVNQAAAEARGEHLLLLNNDVLVVGDSIGDAVALLESDSSIGAVGGRIVLLDGTLQEAGSIVWADGSCSGYGRGADPGNPEYCFRREVDFCSGAFLMTPKRVFDSLGGLDEEYSPAYYEEVDYCARLAASGKKCVYESSVNLLHYEFASSGSHGRAQLLQQAGRDRFRRKQEAFLKTRLDSKQASPLSARCSRRSGRRILLIDDRVPERALGAGLPRANSLVRALISLGHCVTFCPVASDAPLTRHDVPPELEILRPDDLVSHLHERRDYYDTILVSRPHNMVWFNHQLEASPELRAWFSIIYDAEALFSLRELAKSELHGTSPSASVRQQRLAEELAIIRPGDAVVCVSEREASVLRELGQSNVHVLGHMLVDRPPATRFADSRELLFVGSLRDDDSPNSDSIAFFENAIAPCLENHLPGRKLQVVGPLANHHTVPFETEACQYHRRVEDLSSHYSRARVFLAPTRFAAGIPIKVIEAAAHGVPVVATSMLADQLGWQHERELLVADDPLEFAQQCHRLYTDERLWHAIQENALCAVAKDYSNERFLGQLGAILDSTSSTRHSPAVSQKATQVSQAEPVQSVRTFSTAEKQAIQLVSIHLPKTAGTSFGRVLDQVFEHRMYRAYGGHLGEPEFQPGVHRAIHGHIIAKEYFAAFPNSCKVTWFRDPIDRVVSHYDYWMSTPPTNQWHRDVVEANLSLEEFAKLEVATVYAAYVGTVDLSQFDFIGSTEHFETDLSELCRRFGWPQVAPPFLNKRTKHSRVSSETRRVLARTLSREIDIYREAMTRRDALLAKRAA